MDNFKWIGISFFPSRGLAILLRLPLYILKGVSIISFYTTQLSLFKSVPMSVCMNVICMYVCDYEYIGVVRYFPLNLKGITNSTKLCVYIYKGYSDTMDFTTLTFRGQRNMEFLPICILCVIHTHTHTKTQYNTHLMMF